MLKKGELYSKIKHWEDVYGQPFEKSLRSLARYGMSKRQAGEVFGLTMNKVMVFCRDSGVRIVWIGQHGLYNRKRYQRLAETARRNNSRNNKQQ